MMKKFCSVLIWFVTVVFTLAGAENPVRVSFRPARPEAGERVSVTITADSTSRNGAQVILPKLSGRAQWNYNMRSDGSQMSFSSNGQPRITYRFVRQLVTREAGKLEIPPIRIRSGSEELASEPVTLEILPPNTRTPEKTDEVKPFGKLTTTPERPLRPGETLQMKLELFIPENRQLLNISQFDIANDGNAVKLKDPRTGGLIRQLSHYSADVNGREYIVYPFAITLRPALSGEFFPEAVLTFSMREIRQISRDEFNDDIFDSFFGTGNRFGRPENMTLTIKDRAGFKVIPLPPLPAGTVELGVAGKWNFAAKLNTATCRSGEVAELEITATPADGSASAADPMLKASQLEFPGFRVYPPELLRRDGRVILRYALIPLAPGEKRLKFSLASFDPVSSRWQSSAFDLALAVTPGKANVAAPPAVPAAEPAAADNRTPEERSVVPVSGLHYLKSAASKVKLPLIANNMIAIAAWFAGGLLILIADALCRRFRKNFSPQRFARNRDLQKQIAVICREIRSSGDPAEIMKKYGISEIAELSGLPPGATAQDIADRIDEPELKAFFSGLASAGFAPDSMGKTKNSPELREKLLKFLKKLAIFLCVLTAIIASGAGISAYNSGNYARAAEEFRRELHSDQLSPALLYNLGCTEFQLGNYPEARVWFTRALLLDPGDTEIAANLRLTEEKLQLSDPEESSGFTAQLVALRDSLARPDQYLAAASFGFFLLCFLFVLRGSGGNVWRWSVAAAVLFLTVIVLLAAMEQCESTYSANSLILTGKTVEIRSLPVENSGSVLKKVNAGGDAVLIEKRGSWLRISAEGTEGWIPESRAMQVFPYGVL